MKGAGGTMSLPSTSTDEDDEGGHIEVTDGDGHPIICPICLEGFEYGKANVLICGGVNGIKEEIGCQSAFHKNCWNKMKKRTCPVCKRDKLILEIKMLSDYITPERTLFDQPKPKWDWPHSRKWVDEDLRPIDVVTGLSKRGGGKSKTHRSNKSKRNCNNVPCGSCNPYCKPSYCFNKNTVSTKNWCDCNISNKTKKCKQNKLNYVSKISNIKEHNIPIDVLNKKFPYIWRFLRQGTKKEILRLSQLEIDEINIPFSLYDTPSNSKHKKQIKTLKKKYKDI
jgi:hypothetical protein